MKIMCKKAKPNGYDEKNKNLQITGVELIVKDGESLPSAKRTKAQKCT